MKTITLTEEQANLVAVYILITTKYREGEIEACSELAQEKASDGNSVFPKMASNAEWWMRTHDELGRIRKIIDKCPMEEVTL